MGEGTDTLDLKNNIIKSYNLDDHPITLSTVTDTGIRVGSGTLNLYYDHYS